MVGFVEMLKHALQILAYFFNPKLREKREREKVWNEFKELEHRYRVALGNNDPILVATLDQELRGLRAKYKFLNQ